MGSALLALAHGTQSGRTSRRGRRDRRQWSHLCAHDAATAEKGETMPVYPFADERCVCAGSAEQHDRTGFACERIARLAPWLSTRATPCVRAIRGGLQRSELRLAYTSCTEYKYKEIEFENRMSKRLKKPSCNRNT